MAARPDPDALRLAVIGVGALGSALCRILMEEGHGRVLLIDPDELEERNVGLSALFGEAALLGDGAGVAKVDVVRRMAARRGLAWDAVEAEIADVGWMQLRGCDLLVCCADSVLARVETAGVARSLGLPMLEGGVASDGQPRGRVAYFPAAREQACYACGLSEHRLAEVLAYALSGSLGCVAGPDFRAMTGALAVLREVAGEMYGQIGAMLGSDCGQAFALRLDVEAGLRERVTLSRSAGCPWHELPGVEDLSTLQDDEPIADALDDGGSVELLWPVCLRAWCLACGLTVEPCRRTALVRRRGVCGRCGGKLEPLESVGSLRAGDWTGDWAATRTPRQLGLPERHLYYRKPDARQEKRRASD